MLRCLPLILLLTLPPFDQAQAPPRGVRPAPRSNATSSSPQAKSLFGETSRKGVIALTRNDTANARAAFEAALRMQRAPDAVLNIRQWIAMTDLYAGNLAGALYELESIAAAAVTGRLPAQIRAAHEHSAIVETYLGSRSSAASHLSAAESAPSAIPVTSYGVRAVVLARLGDRDAARAAASVFKSRQPSRARLSFVEAVVALSANDVEAAERAIARGPNNDMLIKAVRAEVSWHRDRIAEATALYDEVLKSTIKLDGATQVDPLKLAARLMSGTGAARMSLVR
jgi:hypothetical protein